jgi:succinyl-diaminopimelate desuccinylase
MDVVHLTRELVKIKSENPPGNTEEVIHYIKGFLDSLGVRTAIIRNRGGRDNLISANLKHHLLLCGHVDVVPAMPDGWRHPPFSGTIEDGYLYGRGSTDMKGGCAALLSSYQRLIDAGKEPDVDFLFVCDEETSGTYGIRCILSKDLLRPCDVIIAEPSPELNPNIGEKGLCRINLHFRGEPGHGSLYPTRGVSAVMEAYQTLDYLRKIHRHEYHVKGEVDTIIEKSSRVLRDILGVDEAKHILRRVMFNPGRIEGGEKANIVAQHCDLQLDIRVPWGCSIPDLIADIARNSPGATVEEVSISDPSMTSPDCRLVEVTCREISRVYGSPAQPIVQWAASDARYLRTEGFRVVEYGPAEITLLHAVNERVSIEALEKSTEVFEGIIADSGEDKMMERN